MKRTLIMAGAILLPLSADADQIQRIVCTFTTECIDTEACSETNYEMSMAYNPSGLDPIAASPTITPPDPFTVSVSDITGDFRAAPITDDGLGGPMTGFVTFNDGSDQRLFTVTEGVGRYSVHMKEAGMAIYYEGDCSEEMN